jgi:hypothetical protein
MEEGINSRSVIPELVCPMWICEETSCTVLVPTPVPLEIAFDGNLGEDFTSIDGKLPNDCVGLV